MGGGLRCFKCKHLLCAFIFLELQSVKLVKVDSKDKKGTVYPSICILTRTDGRDARTVDTRGQKELLLQGVSAQTF